ncbi:hypothetical protein Pst134EA_030440, partial [Puccinia striiformis f. sp. tritici]|uniref:hypothetical protein n=1 Tax=Puccinia striiformis f. sp. tritici TaxID=168172 RepID=UPI0020089E02
DHQIGPITSDDSADPIELTEAVFVAIKSINPIDRIQSATSARLTTKERYKLAFKTELYRDKFKITYTSQT